MGELTLPSNRWVGDVVVGGTTAISRIWVTYCVGVVLPSTRDGYIYCDGLGGYVTQCQLIAL